MREQFEMTMQDGMTGRARAAIQDRQRQNQIFVLAALLALGLYGGGLLTLVF